jgi:hypothetical protein
LGVGARATRYAAATVVATCAIASQLAPAAHAAKRAVSNSIAPPPVEPSAVAHQRHAERPARGDAPAPRSSAPPAAPLAAPVRSAAEPSPVRHGHGGRRSAPQGSQATTPSGASSASGAAVPAAAGSVAPAASRQDNGGQKGGGRAGGGQNGGNKHELQGVKSGEAQAAGKQGASRATGSKAQRAPARQAPVAAPAAATPPAPLAPVASAANAGAPVAAPTAQASPAPALAGKGARASRSRRAHRRRRAQATRSRRSRGAAALAVPATALLAPVAAPTVSPTRTARARSRVGGGTYSHSPEPAIVHTITRIVGVVPVPARVLIAALAALALALGLRSLLSGARTRRLVRQRGELLEDVGLLQAALLPDPPARLGPVGTSVAYRPAEGPAAGGDFYDVFALEAGQLAVIVGDVSGHGREALPHTALIRFTVRAYLEAGLAPAAALQTAGAVLERQLGGSFATVFAAVYHPRERTLTYATAGHPPPLVLGDAPADAPQQASAIAPVTACSAPPLGAGMRTGTRETVVALHGPARVCAYTDGVTEARVGEELFGAERLSQALRSLPQGASAADLLDSVAARSSARPDDMAACLLQVHGGAGAPAIVHERLELDATSAGSERVRRFLRECGVTEAQAAASVEHARRELEHARTVSLQLSYDDGAPLVSVRGERESRAALTAVGAS